jgi:hypothetical protein
MGDVWIASELRRKCVRATIRVRVVGVDETSHQRNTLLASSGLCKCPLPSEDDPHPSPLTNVHPPTFATSFTFTPIHDCIRMSTHVSKNIATLAEEEMGACDAQ